MVVHSRLHFFKEMTRILGISHRTSAAQAPRTNGLAGNLVGRASQMPKIYAKNESVIPIIQLCLRASVHTGIGVSPFEILHGYSMLVSASAEVNPCLPFTGEPLAYLQWLEKTQTVA